MTRAATGWGENVPYAGWIVVDLRDPPVAAIIGVVAEHSTECDVDHGNTRHIFAHREFVDDEAYNRLSDLGYREYPMIDFVRYPGGEGVFKVLGLLEVASPRNRWAGLICLRYERRFIDVQALIDAEHKAFSREPLEDPNVIGLATGPIPRPDNTLPAIN